MPQFGSSPVTIYVVAGVAIVLRFAFRELRDRRMHVGRLFIVPGIFAVIALLLAGSAAVAAPQAAFQLIGAVVVAIVLGFSIGTAVGHFTTLRLDERPGFVVVRGSAITVAIWIGAVALRVAIHLAVPSHDRADTTIANAALIVLLAAAIFFVRYRIHKLALLRSRRRHDARDDGRLVDFGFIVIVPVSILTLEPEPIAFGLGPSRPSSLVGQRPTSS